MITTMTCRMMSECDIDLVVPMYIEHYNTYEDGEWTQETTYKRIHQVWFATRRYSLSDRQQRCGGA